MNAKEYITLFSSFLSLRPSLEQIENVARYSARYFTGSFSPTVKHSPLSVGFVITYKCNRNCGGCYIRAIVKDDAGLLDMDMDIDRFAQILSHPAIRKSFRAPLIGGEPLLHKNFFDFASMAHKAKKLVYTFTNGLLIEERLAEFRNARLDTLRVSLYDDALDEQKRNVAKLLSVKPNFKVFLSAWTTPRKMASLDRVVEIALELGVAGLNVQNYMPHSDGKDPNELSMLIWEDDTKTLEHLAQLKREVGNRLRMTLPVPIPRNGHPSRCICLYTMLYVDRRGLIVPCPGIWPPSPEYGNLLEEGWNSSYMADFRRNFSTKFPYNHVCKHCFWGYGMIQNNSDFLLA